MPVRWLPDRLARLLQQERFQLPTASPLEPLRHRKHLPLGLRSLLHVVQYRVPPRRTIPHQRPRWLPARLEEHLLKKLLPHNVEVGRPPRQKKQVPEPHQLSLDETEPLPPPDLPGRQLPQQPASQRMEKFMRPVRLLLQARQRDVEVPLPELQPGHPDARRPLLLPLPVPRPLVHPVAVLPVVPQRPRPLDRLPHTLIWVVDPLGQHHPLVCREPRGPTRTTHLLATLQ